MYFDRLPQFFSVPLLILFVIGCIGIFYRVFLYFDKLVSEKDIQFRLDFFLFVYLAVFFLIMVMSVASLEGRYLLPFLAVGLIIVGRTLDVLYKYLAQNQDKFVAGCFVACVLGLAIWANFSTAKTNIEGKLNSYEEIQQAGLWLENNTEVGDCIVTQSLFQVSYYSNRETMTFSEYLGNTSNNCKYLMLSAIERSSVESYQYPEQKNLTLSHTISRFGGEVMVAIYELDEAQNKSESS
jgi:hypothetical protein